MKNDAPRRGFETSAIQKKWSIRCEEFKKMDKDLFPKVRMVEPLAAMRSWEQAEERSEDETGKTLSSAPESIKKWRPEFLSKIDMVEG